jgi:outer membrane protein TolC
MKWQPCALAILGYAGVFGCAGALLDGCSVGPAYKRPDIASPAASPAQWRESTDGAGPHASSVWPEAEWWHGFGSARLDELIAEAERSNDDLAGAIARVQEADAQARIAGAALLPSLDAGMTASRQRAQVSGEGPKVYNDFNPELSASYEISGAKIAPCATPRARPRRPAATISKPWR